MIEPITFPSATSHFSLPLLFTGQAQKEFFLNQSFAMIDALLQASVLASLAEPPATPVDGSCYRILVAASGDWAGHDDEIAIRLGGTWHYIAAQDGMMVFDRAGGAFLHYDSGWHAASEPVGPTGGAFVDAEARLAISGLIQALRNVGIFAKSG